MNAPHGFRWDGDVVCLTTAQLIGQVTARLAAAGAPCLPLYVAAQQGLIALAQIEQSTATWPKRLIRSYRRPIVALIGDDPWPRGQSLGPNGWACSQRLRKWVGATGQVIVHGGAGEPDHYRAAIVAAQIAGRCAFIECDSEHAQEWAEFFRPAHVLLIAPPPKQVHPTSPDRADMH